MDADRRNGMASWATTTPGQEPLEPSGENVVTVALLTPADSAEPARYLAPIVRLHNGLVDGTPSPEVLVTVSAEIDALDLDLDALWDASPSVNGRDVAAVDDFSASLEVLHEVAQSVLGSLSAMTQAPRELGTVVALSTHRVESLTADFERRVAEVAEDLTARIEASVEAAREIRQSVLGDIVENRDQLMRLATVLVERMESADARFLKRSGAVMSHVADHAVEAAEVVHLATEQAVAEMTECVREMRNERRRNERALERVTERLLEHVDARLDEVMGRMDARVDARVGELLSAQRRFRRG